MFKKKKKQKRRRKKKTIAVCDLEFAELIIERIDKIRVNLIKQEINFRAKKNPKRNEQQQTRDTFALQSLGMYWLTWINHHHCVNILFFIHIKLEIILLFLV